MALAEPLHPAVARACQRPARVSCARARASHPLPAPPVLTLAHRSPFCKLPRFFLFFATFPPSNQTISTNHVMHHLPSPPPSRLLPRWPRADGIATRNYTWALYSYFSSVISLLPTRTPIFHCGPIHPRKIILFPPCSPYNSESVVHRTVIRIVQPCPMATASRQKRSSESEDKGTGRVQSQLQRPLSCLVH